MIDNLSIQLQSLSMNGIFAGVLTYFAIIVVFLLTSIVQKKFVKSQFLYVLCLGFCFFLFIAAMFTSVNLGLIVSVVIFVVAMIANSFIKKMAQKKLR